MSDLVDGQWGHVHAREGHSSRAPTGTAHPATQHRHRTPHHTAHCHTQTTQHKHAEKSVRWPCPGDTRARDRHSGTAWRPSKHGRSAQRGRPTKGRLQGAPHTSQLSRDPMHLFAHAGRSRCSFFVMLKASTTGLGVSPSLTHLDPSAALTRNRLEGLHAGPSEGQACHTCAI